MEPKTTFFMPINCGDYLRKTQHLSPLEHGCYNLLRIHYWENGGQFKCDGRGNAQALLEHGTGICLTIDQSLYRVCNAHSQEERRAVEVVVSEFFPFVDGKHTHSDLDKEVKRVQKQTEKNSDKGKRGAEERWKRAREKGPKEAAVEGGIVHGTGNGTGNAQAMAIPTQTLKGFKTPYPLTVDNSGDNSEGIGFDGGQVRWDILEHIADRTVDEVKLIARQKNIDFRYMVTKYNEGMVPNGGTRRELPKEPNRAFLAWARSYSGSK